MQKEAYLEFRNRCRSKIQQGLATVTEIMSYLDVVYELGRDEKAVEPVPDDHADFHKVMLDWFEALPPTPPNRCAEIDEYLSIDRSPSGVTYYIRQNHHGTSHLVERNFGYADHDVVLRSLTTEELEYCNRLYGVTTK